MSDSLVRCRGLLHGVVAYVDIRSPFGNPGMTISQRLISLGATVETTRNAYVTHVIFRNGDPMTKLWAEKRGLSLVTPAWVKACAEEKCRIPEACYYLKEKEDVDFVEDFNLIASRNTLPAQEASTLSIPHFEPKIQSVSSVNTGSILSPNAPPSVREFRNCLNVWQQKVDSSTISDSTSPPPLSAMGFSSPPRTPISTAPKPPPGWMCLPSPLQQVENLPLPLFPEDDTRTLGQIHPRLSDVLGSSSRIPLSPDILHYVVRNFVNAAVKKARKTQIKSRTPYPAPVKVTLKQEKKIVDKTTPTPRRRKAKKQLSTPVRLQSSMRKQLRDGIQASSAPKGQHSNAKNVEDTSGRKKSQRRTRKKPSNANSSVRKSLRLSVKAGGSTELTKEPFKGVLDQTSTVISVDEEISLRSEAMNLSSSETMRDSLDDFINLDVDLRPCRRRTRSSISSPNRPIEITFSGLNAFQRQTLITLLRSSAGLSKHEVTPSLNARLCRNDHGDGEFTNCSKNSETVVPSTVLRSERSAVYENLNQRWRLADTLNPRTTTHLVTTVPFPRTVNLFKAVVASVPVVSEDWIVKSARAGKWLPIKRFLVSGLPSAKAAPKLRNLFSTAGHIFVASGTSPSPSILKELVVMGGGSLSKRAVGAELVVGQVNPKKPSVSPKWILDSILRQSLLPFEKYRISD